MTPSATRVCARTIARVLVVVIRAGLRDIESPGSSMNVSCATGLKVRGISVTVGVSIAFGCVSG
jgi:hypothetical protein